MKKIWLSIGNILFWALWPVWYFYFHNTERSRLLVVCDQQILLVKSWLGDGSFSLPGGGHHRGESLKDSAIRELKEETDLSLNLSQVKQLAQFEIKNQGINVKIHGFYTIIPKPIQPKAQRGEIAEVKWSNINGLNTRERLSPDAKKIIELWKSNKP